MVLSPRSSSFSNKTIVSSVLSLPLTSLILLALNLRLQPSPPPPGNTRVLAAFSFRPTSSHLPRSTSCQYSPQCRNNKHSAPAPTVTTIPTPWISCLKVKGSPSDQPPRPGSHPSPFRSSPVGPWHPAAQAPRHHRHTTRLPRPTVKAS